MTGILLRTTPETAFILASTALAFLLAQIIKYFTFQQKQPAPWWRVFFTYGGMPSVHTATLVAITTSIFLTQGITPLFLLSFVISTLIIRDAMTLRTKIGQNAESLDKLLHKHKNLTNTRLGHTLPEVAVGLGIGIASTIMLFLFFF
ncbi:hypothetical protein D6783_01705 [Candidatus Woesearchaeota archaeon]|nr:MAG: hypothetical protein D6783_01705 [Candidatus Woesearchaeota archaeon]